jgi:hypothetical protein
MYKFMTALCLSIILGVGALAQAQTETTTTARTFTGDDKKENSAGFDSKNDAADPEPTTISNGYSKNEFYLGYSNQQVGNSNRSAFQGFQGAYVRNVSRWFGIRGDFSYAKDNRTLHGSFADSTGAVYSFQQTNARSVINVLGGVQIKDNASTKRFKPFAFALGGVAVNRTSYKDFACSSATCPSTLPLANFSYRDTGLAGSFGGGLDIRVNKRVDFRAIQIDYNPIYSNSRVDNNFRIGVGFVFR